MPSPNRLHQLQLGQRAVIVRMGGSVALRRRFAEMGILKGVSIQAERVAPLGDPVAYLVKGYRLSLRREEAAQIEIDLEGGAHE